MNSTRQAPSAGVPAERLRVVVGDAEPPGLPRRAAPVVRHAAFADGSPPLTSAESGARTSRGGLGRFERASPPSEPAAAQLDAGSQDASDPDQPGPVGSILVQRAVSFGRAHAAILGVVVVVALVFTGSRVMAARGHDVEPVAVTPVATAAATPTPSQSSSAPTPIQVHVLGAVQSPGVVSVPSGARVAQAIDAAGGLRPDADPAELNLAAVVADGAQIIIGTTAQPRGEIRVDAGSSGGSGAGPAAGSAPTLNLNTATVQQLESLPGIGPVTAARIIAWREANGGFTRVEELQEVDGIGPKTYASLAPLVHV